MDKKKLIEEYLQEAAPKSQLDIALAYAELKGKYDATQLEVSKLLGISDRSLRQYIQNNKAEYEERLAEVVKEKEPKADLDNLSRTLTEEQLDKFVQSLINSAISPNATVRDRQLLIDFAGLTADDLLNLQAVKSNSIRWHIKGNLSTISKFMDTRELGIMLQSSPYLYNGDKESAGNTQRFVNKSLEDEDFKRELMYMGLAFMSLYNGVQHPDLELMQTIVKLDRIEKGIKEPMNMLEVKAFAKGENIVKDDKKPKVNQARLNALMAEVEKEYQSFCSMLPEESKARLAKIRKDKEKETKVFTLTKPPVLPDVEIVEAKANEHYEELEVLLTLEDEIKSMLRKSGIKITNN